ncbi:MAG: hypothetical protein A2017_06950 [Lentisphaerae bacterium GWF2_44_16]|nr:MAG: hypothetical protein A2017_06950 [Lentisphaerae bacterium GWF2_44_16]
MAVKKLDGRVSRNYDQRLKDEEYYSIKYSKIELLKKTVFEKITDLIERSNSKLEKTSWWKQKTK